MTIIPKSRHSVCLAVSGLLFSLTPAFAQPAPSKTSFKLRGKEQIIFPREKLEARGLTPPSIPDDQNAAWVYVDAMNAYVELPKDLEEFEGVANSGTWPDGDAGKQLSDWLDQNSEAIALTRKAGAMPQYYMPMVCEGENNSIVSALLPTLGPMRSLAKMMAISAARDRQSDPDAAVDDAIAMQQLAHHAAQGSTLIEGMVGMAIGSLAEKSLRWSLEDGTLSAEKLASVSAELNKLAETQPDWERMIRGEEKFSEGHIDDALNASGAVLGLFNPYGAYGAHIDANPSGWQQLARRLKRVYMPDRLIKKHNRSYYDRMIAAARDEEQTGNLKLDEDKLLADIPAWNVIGKIMLPSLARTHDVTLLRRANFERTRVAMAAAAYKKTHGQAPTTLADLTPAFLSSVPKDPLTGRELEYSPAADGKSFTGLEPIEGDKAKAFHERRKVHAEAQRAEATHPWRLLVKEYTDRYQFDEAQRTAADAIFRELEARSIAYAKSLAPNQKPDPAVEEQLTAELIKRLTDLPTAAQRAADKKQDR